MSEIIYSREELKLLVQPFIKTNSKGRTDILEKRIPQELKEQIILSTDGCREERFSERVFWILKDIYEYPICIECGKQWKPRYYGLSTKSFNEFKFCSNKCVNNSKEVRHKIKETNLRIYGSTIALGNPEIQEQIRMNYFQKTGYYHHLSNPLIKEKKKKNYKIKTGYENPAQNPEVQEKMKQTYFNKTGYYNPAKNPEVQEKMAFTNLTRYGVKYTLQNKEIRELGRQNFFKKTGYYHNLQNPESKRKSIETSLKNWGTEYPMQSEEIFLKQQNSANTYKKLLLPSGKEISYMGYEDIAIKKLLEDFIEEEIILNRYEIPQIWYKFKDKNRRYYPDIWIPSQNLIIEVKSTYTYEKDLEKNMKKREATLELGYNFQFWICNDNQVLRIF